MSNWGWFQKPVIPCRPYKNAQIYSGQKHVYILLQKSALVSIANVVIYDNSVGKGGVI